MALAAVFDLILRAESLFARKIPCLPDNSSQNLICRAKLVALSSARSAIAVINSVGSTGFGTNILKPADNARTRSSTLTYAVNATAGILFVGEIQTSTKVTVSYSVTGERDIARGQRAHFTPVSI
jgi:hypothetical protein